MVKQRRRILFIINPRSGTGKQKKAERLIHTLFRHDCWDYSIVFTSRAGEAPEISSKAAEEGYEAVVAVGGDGTINEVARGLAGSKTALGIVPVGSGNGLARYLGISVRPEKALKTIRRFRMRDIDTASLNGHMFVSIAGTGFDAYVAEQFSKSKIRGLWAYLRIAISAYMFYQPKRYKLIIDGKVMKRRAFLISFANSDQFGFNVTIAPGAKIDDGMIDVCLLRKPRIYIAYLLIPFIFLKLMHKTPFLKIVRAKHVVVYQRKRQVSHIDGDEIHLGKRLEVHVHEKNLRIICP
jgi:diacylglycerol kinase (ATP)